MQNICQFMNLHSLYLGVQMYRIICYLSNIIVYNAVKASIIIIKPEQCPLKRS